jgi:hypothetical protein
MKTDISGRDVPNLSASKKVVAVSPLVFCVPQLPGVGTRTR